MLWVRFRGQNHVVNVRKQLSWGENSHIGYSTLGRHSIVGYNHLGVCNDAKHTWVSYCGCLHPFGWTDEGQTSVVIVSQH